MAATRVTLPDYSSAELESARRRENFPIAAWLLRPGRREARAAIYGFCRLVDDIGDEGLGEAVAQLDRCREELEACYDGRPQHPIFSRLQPVIRRHHLERGYFLRLIHANLQDQEFVRYATWEQLDTYCTLSATPVGQLVLALEGITDEGPVAHSDSVCTGLQLANMWQDITSDRLRGRRYLPLEVLAAHGVSEEEWESGRPTPGNRAALLHAVGRARRLLREGWPLAREVPGLMRVEMATFILAGLAATDAVVAAGDLVFVQKASLAPRQRRATLVRSLFAWRGVEPPPGR
ncbi:MAG: squalene synthase HpnC [Candidatus Dormibacteria bacterium]